MRFKFLILSLLLLPAFSLHAETDHEKQLFGYVNSEREREGVKPLQWDKDLYRVALAHSEDMATMHKVSHTGSDHTQPDERLRNAKIYASKSAENIAGDINVIAAHTGLMTSLYHRRNILDPDFTHAADAIYEDHGYLYVTEMFIKKLSSYTVENARKEILDYINEIRARKHLPPVTLSKTLSNVAQTHVQVQAKMNAMSPLLIIGVLQKQLKGPVVVSAYTTDNLHVAADELMNDFESDGKTVGIGFTETQGAICEGGCYLIALIFAASDSQS
jgi:uncharacterized protein YkwD